MRDLIADVRYAARALLARPSFTAAAILTLGIGIGMTTAVFSFLDAVVLRPLPLRSADRLVSLCEQYPGATADWCSIAPPNIYDIRARVHSLDGLGIGRSWSATMATPTGNANIPSGIASDGMFEALGIRPELGRLIEPADLIGRPSAVAVISHAMWQSDFAGASDIIGRKVILDGAPVTIVGVLEPSAAVPLFPWIKLWRPLHINPRDEQNREWRGFVAYGRLRDGVPLATAQKEIAAVSRDLRARYFSATAGWDIVTQPLKDLIVGSVRGPLMFFFGAVLLVLLIACANVANLILARGAGRGREMAIRSAIGASRARMVRSLLLESVLLALAGAAIGVGIAVWANDAFRSLAPTDVPRIDQVSMSGTVLAFTAALAIITSVVFGLVPALRVSRVDLAQSLRDGGRAGAGRSGRLGRLLVVAEVAIALPLVTSAALLARSFVAQMSWQPGFEREHLLTFSMFAPSSAYANNEDVARIWDRLEHEVAGIPGVKAVGTASGGPLFGGLEDWEMEIEGQPPNERPSIRWFDAGPGFFSALGVPFVRGHDFDQTDIYGAPASGLVNETLANRYWPGQNPIGKHIVFPHGKDRETFTVKGVVRDVPSIKPGVPTGPQLYWSNRYSPRPFTYFVVRTTVPPASIVPMIRERFKTVNRDFTIANVAPMSELVDDQLRVPKFGMTLLFAFGLAALVLTGVGTYGLLAYLVAQRQKDIGIRLALGAQQGMVVRDVVRNGLALAVPGIVIGVGASLLLARTIRGFVAGVSPFDPASLVVSVVVVFGVALAACAVPAWRASRVDPAATLVAE